ncbi:MAG: hypothetical protein H0V07_07185 [Propionibacteriales bacterium]|nr:hypothetical protein [Propionibacteriales bacterium]
MSEAPRRREAVRLRHQDTLLHQVLVGGGLVAVAAVVGLIAWRLFEGSSPDTFGRALAGLLLQLALIVVLGAAIKFVVDSYADRRARLDREQQERIELLRRMRAQHVKVAFAQRLILAHQTGKTYTEQLRVLMIVGAELEDLAEDVRATVDLFGDDHGTVIFGIEEIVSYLAEGSAEYVECHAKVDADAVAKKNLEHMIRTHNMVWVKEFIAPSPSFPDSYAQSLAKCKGRMRQHAYGR